MAKQHEKVDNELQEKVLYVNRSAKVVKGGRKFSFSALVVVGDGKGRIGCGFAKANELTDAIRKSGESARRNLITVPMNGTTIPHEVLVRWDGVSVLLKPAPPGTGVIVGSKARDILVLAGVRDIMGKNLGASNPINQVQATFKALQQLRTRDQIKESRRVV